MSKFEEFKDIINFIIIVLFIALFSFIIPLLAITLGHGGEEQQNIELFQIMGVWGIIGIVIIGLLKLGEFITNQFKGKEVYRKIGWIGVSLHDPEKGLLTNIKQWGFEDKNKPTFILFRWMESPFYLLVFSLPFFAIVALILLLKKSLLTALPNLTFQQISKFAEGVLAVEPAGLEIFLPLAFLGLFIHIMFYLEDIKTLPKGIKWIPIMLFPLIYGLLWMGLHKLLHPDSQIALSYVYIFGVISAYLVVLTGSIIPAWVFKDMNNLFSYLEGALKSNEKILALTMMIIFIYLIIIGAVVFIKYSLKNRKQMKEHYGRE